MRFDMDEMRNAAVGGVGYGVPGSAPGSVSKSLGAEILGKMNWLEEEGREEGDVGEEVEEQDDTEGEEEEEIQTIITRKKRVCFFLFFSGGEDADDFFVESRKPRKRTIVRKKRIRRSKRLFGQLHAI